MSKKKRCSSGQNFVAPRLIWMGSGLTKCCGVCTTPIVGIAKQRHGAFQELRGGHEIGVEDRDEFGRIGQRSDMFQRVVDVSSLGMRIV